MTKLPALSNPRTLSVATLLFVGYLSADALAQPLVAPAPAAPPRPAVRAPVPQPKPSPPSQVAAGKSVNDYNHVIGIANPHRQSVPPLGTVPMLPIIAVNFWDSNDSAVAAPATRVLVAVNGIKVGVKNLPALPAGTAKKKVGDYGIFTWVWTGSQRMWSIPMAEVACLRTEPRPNKYADDTAPNVTRQYHSGCIYNIKIWMDVPEKIPCTFIGTVCVELLPTTTPAYSGDIEVLDDVSGFPPCRSPGQGTNCLTPGFGWRADP